MEAWRASVPAISDALVSWHGGRLRSGRYPARCGQTQVASLPFVIPRRAEDLPVFDKDAKEIEYDLWHGYRKL